MATYTVKRVYDPYEPADGFRILVDRLWPRGLSKDKAHIDLWLKEIAPGNALRKWYGHDPDKWDEFRKRYRKELEKSDAVHDLFAAIKDHKKITLLFSSKEEKLNNAYALLEWIREHRHGT